MVHIIEIYRSSFLVAALMKEMQLLGQKIRYAKKRQKNILFKILTIYIFYMYFFILPDDKHMAPAVFSSQ